MYWYKTSHSSHLHKTLYTLYTCFSSKTYSTTKIIVKMLNHTLPWISHPGSQWNQNLLSFFFSTHMLVQQLIRVKSPSIDSVEYNGLIHLLYKVKQLKEVHRDVTFIWKQSLQAGGKAERGFEQSLDTVISFCCQREQKHLIHHCHRWLKMIAVHTNQEI